jgi:outer membrane protein TolC
MAAPAKEPAKPSSERLRELQKARVEALKEQMEGQWERVKIGKDPMIHFIEAVRELGEAELDLAEKREERLGAYERMVKILLEGEDDTAGLVNAGLQTKQGLAQIKAARLKAEIQLEKFKLSK